MLVRCQIPLQLAAATTPGDRWAALANDRVDFHAAQAARDWLPQEAYHWSRARQALLDQDLQLQSLLQLHLHSAELYTGGHGRTNRPTTGESLLVSPDAAPRPLPPSLTRPAMAPRAQRTLEDWTTSRKRSLDADPPEAKRPKGQGSGNDYDRHGGSFKPGLLLARTPCHLDLLSWKEIWPRQRVCEVLPFIERSWQATAPALWLTWVELAVLYCHVLGRPPPRWLPKQRRLEGGYEEEIQLPTGLPCTRPQDAPDAIMHCQKPRGRPTRHTQHLHGVPPLPTSGCMAPGPYRLDERTPNSP